MRRAHQHTTRIQQHQVTCRTGLGSTSRFTWAIPTWTLPRPSMAQKSWVQSTCVFSTTEPKSVAPTGSQGHRRTLDPVTSIPVPPHQGVPGNTSLCGHLCWDFNSFWNSADLQSEGVNLPSLPLAATPGGTLALGTCKDCPSPLLMAPAPVLTAGAQRAEECGCQVTLTPKDGALSFLLNFLTGRLILHSNLPALAPRYSGKRYCGQVFGEVFE